MESCIRIGAHVYHESRQQRRATKTVRYFPDKLPIGMQPHADSHVFVFLVTRPSPMDFRLFLLRHVALLRVLCRWTVRLLVPSKLVKARLAYLHAAREPVADTVAPLGG